MEILLWTGAILFVVSAAALNETTSSSESREFLSEDFQSLNNTFNVENGPLENGTVSPADAAESKEEVAAAEEPLEISFPDNHKNSTEYLHQGGEVHLPYYDHLNNYQQQYKAYVEQKQLFNRKPIKFEEDSKEKSMWHGWDVAKDVQGGYGPQEKRKIKLPKKPFPYVFEHDKVQDWYDKAGLNGAGEEAAKNEFRVGGHQGISEFVFPRDYSQDQKPYKTESVTHVREAVKKGKGSHWKKIFHLLTALVPLGLVLASLTPNVISVNSTAVTKNTRQRSEDSFPMRFIEVDAMELMNKFGVESLAEAQCEDRLICELGRRGNASAASHIEKRFWFLANETPWDEAEKAGMNDLFKAIKTGSCESYKCYSGVKSMHKSLIGKKLIGKRRILEK